MSSSVPGTPRTPTTTKKKLTTRGLNAPKSVGGTPRPTHPSMVSPRPSLPSANWERKKTPLLVYEHAKSITNVPGKLQGVWQCGYQATVSPTELWIFRTEDAPAGLEGSKHIHGYWGLDPDALDPGDPLPDDLSTIDPLRLWVYSPQATVPKFFTPRGVWTYPLIKRDISHLSPEQAGFLHVTDSVKTHKLDVPGSWKMLYRRDGLPEVPIGPGMSPRKNIVKPITVIVETPSGEQIPIDKVLPTDTLDKLKKKIEAKEGTPMEDQRLAKNGVPLKGDPTQTLKKLGIHNQDVLTLQGITVHVKPFRGPILTFENLDPRNTTLDQLQDRIDVLPKPMQRLFFEGEPLTNPTASLHDCGIIHESTLTLEPMEITIQTPQGESIQLQVDPNDTVKDIKQKLADEHDIPVDEQRLEFQGKPLKDHDTPAELGIKHGDTIQMTPMEVTVRDAKGKEFSVEVQPDDTVEDLKARIEDQEQIPKAEQRLAFQGKPLSNDKKSLKSYGIEHGSILDLEPMEITIQTPQGESIQLQVDPNDTVKDIKQKLADEHDIPVDEQRLEFQGKPLKDHDTPAELGIKHGDTIQMTPMEVTVRDAKGKEFSVEVQPDDTVEDLKARIEDQEQIPKAEQRLAFQGKPLSNDKKSLKSYGIEHGSILDLEPMEITIQTPQGESIQLQIDPNDTVKDIKQKLADEHDIPVDEQRLEFQGKPLKDHDTPAELGIKHGDTIQMTPMEVTVRDAKGKEFSVEVQPDDTVEDLKARIEDQEQIPKAEQRLAFEGKPLSKDKKSLKSYGIQHGSMLDLEPMTISVETPTGEHVDVPFSPNDTIADIKNKLEELHGIPVKDQRLAFKDNELSDQSTLKDNGIQHGDTLKVISDMQIIVKDWRNKSIPFVVTPSDTIASIRKRIQQIKDMDPEKQILTFEDTPLDDNEKSLADYNITNGSTIQLDRFKIYVECPSHGKFLMEVEPHWKIKVLQQSVEARFKVKMDQQEPTFHGFKGKLLPNSTIEACGIQHKDTVVVKEINIPKYDVHMGAWQDPFHYSPKSPLKKKVGVRRATTHDTSKDNFVASQRETALTADIWSKLQGKDSKEPK